MCVDIVQVTSVSAGVAPIKPDTLRVEGCG
jgi:hypothetical protein